MPRGQGCCNCEHHSHPQNCPTPTAAPQTPKYLDQQWQVTEVAPILVHRAPILVYRAPILVHSTHRRPPVSQISQMAQCVKRAAQHWATHRNLKTFDTALHSPHQHCDFHGLCWAESEACRWASWDVSCSATLRQTSCRTRSPPPPGHTPKTVRIQRRTANLSVEIWASHAEPRLCDMIPVHSRRKSAESNARGWVGGICLVHTHTPTPAYVLGL